MSLEELKSCESFYKWFLEAQKKLFAGFNFTSSTSTEDDDEEITLDQKRRNERVKKFISFISDSDILLELAEDERTKADFVAKYFSLEAFSVLGTIAFLNAYLHHSSDTVHSEADQSLTAVGNFIRRCKSVVAIRQDYVEAMESVFWWLRRYHNLHFQLGESVDENANSKFQDCSVDKKVSSGVLGMKMYFLGGFPDQMFLEPIERLLDQIPEEDCDNFECILNLYYIKRTYRISKIIESSNNSSPSTPNHQNGEQLSTSDLNEEKSVIESAYKKNPKNPRCILGACQFLADFIGMSNGPNDVEFAEMKFDKHSDIVTFIRDCSIEVCEKFPSYLRAFFTYADIFATELPITKQDREYAKSLLNKALLANPNSSKINHKMGLFLIKSRQFQEARSYILKSTELDRNNAQAYYSLVKLLLRDTTGNNKIFLESFFNAEFSTIIETLGPENELPFWKGCYFFLTGDRDLAINIWVEIILEFYVTKPELDLGSVLPFEKLPSTAKSFLWARTPLTLDNVTVAVKDAISQETSRRRIVFHRLMDLVNEANNS